MGVSKQGVVQFIAFHRMFRYCDISVVYSRGQIFTNSNNVA